MTQLSLTLKASVFHLSRLVLILQPRVDGTSYNRIDTILTIPPILKHRKVTVCPLRDIPSNLNSFRFGAWLIWLTNRLFIVQALLTGRSSNWIHKTFILIKT
jgi:hypothetical protein